MFKRIILGSVATIAIAVVLASLYLRSLTAERPEESYAVLSSLHDAEFTTSSRDAENWLKSIYSDYPVPSLSVAIGVNGSLAWSGAIGYADLEKGVLADSDTAYRIGSISKAITASAAMRMSERGIMNIHDPYSVYVDDFPLEDAAFTLKHLLTHQAGIRHYTNKFTENFRNKEYATTREAALLVADDERLFAPGDDFQYSTYGYTLLSLAMESAYALPFEEIISQEVFSPLGMSSSRFDRADQPKNDHQAVPYLLVRDILFEAPEVNLSYKYAGGGYLSTPSDVVKFGNALLGSEFLTSESKASLWTPVPLHNGNMNPENYALGFRVGEDELGRFFHHGGMSIGGYSYLAIYADIGVVVALTTNATPMDQPFDRYNHAKKLATLFAP